MKPPDHPDGKAAFAIKNLRHTGTGSDQRLKVLSRQPLAFHPELNGLDGIRRIHGIVLGLVRIDQDGEHVEAVTLWSSTLRAPQSLDFSERLPVVRLRPNGPD